MAAGRRTSAGKTLSPTYAELYAMAFSWDPEQEFGTVAAMLDQAGLTDGSLVADAGAGTGRFIECLLRRKYRVLAVDPDHDALEVLESRSERLARADGQLALVRGPFETFDAGEPIDAVIAMTDTLSYVIPEPRLNQFVAQAAASLRAGGVLIVDAGVWSGYDGESRSEQWSAIYEGWALAASFSASVCRDRGTDGTFARKVETLAFEARRGSQLVDRSRLVETFAFDHAGLVALMGSHGLTSASSAPPGATPAPVDRGAGKRLFYSFRKL
jgi:SAM-dependent methyltransferase